MALGDESFGLLQQSVQCFIQERPVPAENILEEEDDVPADIVAGMKEMDLFGLLTPEEYGGIGLAMVQECEVVYDLGHTALTFRLVFGTNVGIGPQGILMDGTDAQKTDYLPRIANGELIISFALTELNAGSNTVSLQTRATPNGNHYVISSTKCYITNTPRAGAFTLIARTGGEGAGGISAPIVPADTLGITLGKPDKKVGQRSTKTYDVILDNMRVPAANIIGGVARQGFKAAMRVLDRGHLHISALVCGMAHRLITDAVAYAKGRKQFGQPVADFQLIQAILADSQTELYADMSVVQDRARRCDAKPVGKQDHEVSMLASCAKIFCTEMVDRMADRTAQIHGGAGYIAEYRAEYFYRDVRLLRLYESTTQIQ